MRCSKAGEVGLREAWFGMAGGVWLGMVSYVPVRIGRSAQARLGGVWCDAVQQGRLGVVTFGQARCGLIRQVW